MLIVNIYREALIFDEATIRKTLYPNLLEAARSIQELDISTWEVIFHLPQRVEIGNPMKKIVIFVNGFFTKTFLEGKHRDMSKILAEKLGRAAKSCFPDVVIQCVVSLNPESVFWSSDES